MTMVPAINGSILRFVKYTRWHMSVFIVVLVTDVSMLRYGKIHGIIYE
jgi:hypothetical protein